MDFETLAAMPDKERVEYFNGRLANGEEYEAILAELGIDKVTAGNPIASGGLNLIKMGKEVRSKPGRGDNGFAW